MIIFLDIDGVLVTGRVNKPGDKTKKPGEWNVDPEAVEALNYLIEKLDNPKIVISSTWRLSGLKEMQRQLKAWKVNGEVIDITPICGFSQSRGHEINSWLEKTECKEDFVVIDDENFDLFQLMPDKVLHVINGWFEAGLTKKMVDNFLHWREQNERKKD